MDTIAFTIFQKFTAPREVKKQSRLLLRLALEEFDDVYQDEALAFKERIQQMQTRLAEALDAVRLAEDRSKHDTEMIADLNGALIAAEGMIQVLRSRAKEANDDVTGLQHSLAAGRGQTLAGTGE